LSKTATQTVLKIEIEWFSKTRFML